MTKNQMLIAIRKVKKNQKQIMTLKNLIEAAGSEQDMENDEYVAMQKSLEICTQRIQESVTMMKQYAEENIGG